VDIQKVTKGLKVEIGLDADPKKKLKGEVASVANIGEQLPNMDSKVFEVRILVLDSDSTLRPAMTTSNKIVIAVKPDVLSVPLDCIHNQDSTSFVYLREGVSIMMQEVKLGLTNDNSAEILEGVLPEDKVYLSVPLDYDTKGMMRPSAGRKR
jgi:multidrug efflux pump subunit AcrA (membrane-fusion protein)